MAIKLLLDEAADPERMARFEREASVLDAPGDKEALDFSPDGRYLAFSSDISDRFEVYVVDFPNARARRQVSADGGAGSTMVARRPRALIRARR